MRPLSVELFDSPSEEGVHVKQKSFLEKFIDEDSHSGLAVDEISVFMRSTVSALH